MSKILQEVVGAAGDMVSGSDEDGTELTRTGEAVAYLVNRVVGNVHVIGVEGENVKPRIRVSVGAVKIRRDHCRR